MELARARAATGRSRSSGRSGLGDPTTDVSALAAEPNVHLLGPRPYEGLPAVLRGADAGLIPYVRSALTDSIFPMKVYEYLAAGLPVVATPLPALAGVGGHRHGAGRRRLPAALDARAAARTRPQRRAERSRGGVAHSWDARLREIAGAIEALRPPARHAMSDLLVTTHTPVLRSGQTMRTYGIARALAADGRGLTLLYARFEGDAPDEAFRSIPGIELREALPSRGARRLAAYAARWRPAPRPASRAASRRSSPQRRPSSPPSPAAGA